MKYTLRLAAAFFALCISSLGQGKNPVIVIPGLTGSELIDKATNERIWIRAFKSKNEDLRLPLAADPAKVSDGLVPGDLIRTVKVGPFQVSDYYGGFIKAMETRGGYHEEKWAEPSADGAQDSLYVFPYDWRLDMVANARRLIHDVEELKQRLKRPQAKFDIVAHSMGGLIARYAAMYGDADLPAGNRRPMPTWAGSRHFDKIILLATPNEGSVAALEGFIEGYSINGMRLDIPFVQDTSRFTIFTMPAAYQLLPAPGTMRVFDDKLGPVEVDVHDPKTWSKYGWNPMTDRNFVSEFAATERRVAEDFFEASLARSKQFHEALAASPGKSGEIAFHTIGSDCRTGLDAILLYRDTKENKWRTLFRAKGFTRPDGQKITDDELRDLLVSNGDGTVTGRSLAAATQARRLGVESMIGARSTTLICEGHSKIASNSRVQDQIISLLAAETQSAKK
jgi:pimeloyl-ACP methyl ester carboxylesterase